MTVCHVLDRSVLDNALSGFAGDQKKKAGATVYAKKHFVSLTKAFCPVEKQFVFDLIESLPYLPNADGSGFGNTIPRFHGVFSITSRRRRVWFVWNTIPLHKFGCPQSGTAALRAWALQ